MRRSVVLTTSGDTFEIRSLLDTLEISVMREYQQRRDQPHTKSYLGPGKIEEILEDLKDVEYDLIVTDGDLKPSQHHFLEMKFQKECMDRTGVILGIFSSHAHTPEAIAQVTLAKLRYEQPFLREWIHKAKKGDRPGFLAGGGYATDVYYEHAKVHVRQIEEKLQDISKQREVTRVKRRSIGYSLVSLSGYTNAGKSALFNALTKAKVGVDDRLFSTLSTTTRKISGLQSTVLISDTVGFIRNLPPDLIRAFNSTLEEIFRSDMIIIVVDVSEPLDIVKSKLKTSLDILIPKMPDRRILVVGSKVDKLDQEERQGIKEGLRPLVNPEELVFVSSVSEEGLGLLLRKIEPVVGRTCAIDASLPLSDRSLSLLSRIRKIAYISDKVLPTSVHASIKCRPEDRQKISGWVNAVGGTVVVEEACMKAEDGDPPATGCSRNEGAPLG